MWYYYVGGIVVVLAILIFTVLAIRSKTPKKQPMDINAFTDILSKYNVMSIDFTRNKIVIKFDDIDIVDPNQLQEAGAKGISIVGDVIKFYIDGTPEDNRLLFEQLSKTIKRM
ncbi:hypothetical protein [Candidatus Xianfuyuplasma coldseepsis]|uniref:PTS EIIB type-1 domain-containing protein n=1 Tax=Candidatus Xianfuyuplasma coldseepsis TaxID=2782163 RepID=A0A7L7KTH6_9MOLU|nr:hypothetical protein [Xianfuyuplasma coldseepsis]QMS85602.1 hypothetical protein G4Z02_07560 [Xianfuyuplasma coldseepsis]